MDNIKTERKKKGDKAKEKYERNGGFSQKHIRLAEARHKIEAVKASK